MSLQLSSCDIAVVLGSIQNLKDPDDTAPFSSLGPALLQTIYSYYGVFAWKASHSQHYNHAPGLSRSRGQHRCRWIYPDQHQIEKQSVIMCFIVGEVPHSGYMLWFTQESACLLIRTKPVDMREHRNPEYYRCRRYFLFYIKNNFV